MKWKRRSWALNPNVRLDVAFEEHPRFTIIDVYAADTLGFLYKITDAISRLGLNISFAKIATRGDGIVDTFYVTDRNGQKIGSPEKQDQMKGELVQVIRHLAETELVLT